MFWKHKLYLASTQISIGDTLNDDISSPNPVNVFQVTEGGLNSILSTINGYINPVNHISDITWESGFSPDNGSKYLIQNKNHFIYVMFTTNPISLTYNTLIGTILYGEMPSQYYPITAFDYNSGKPLPGSFWLNPNGEIKYYGDNITNQRIIFSFNWIEA